jgi:UDP-glucuronate 4-epimerase
VRVLVTGGAGFIGSHLCEHLLRDGAEVVALDNFNDFYDPAVKRRNLAEASREPGFQLVEADIQDLEGMDASLRAAGAAPDVIVHLAASAGVRPSIEAPLDYSRNNLHGTTAVLELARRHGVKRFVFGSSSSVYGDSPAVPFSETDPVAEPISPYAATKRAGELLCHTYRHLFGISVVCLRFFTVYGPRQRPDLAIHKFARLMAGGKPIPVFGDGSTRRDYTYIDDIVGGIEGAIRFTGEHPAAFEIVNLGESDTVSLSRLIELLGESLGVTPQIDRMPLQPGDVQQTFADISRGRALLGYSPVTRVEVGIPRFVEWFRTQPR